MTGFGRLRGRDNHLLAMADAFDALAPLVLVVGDAGIGKSRLVAAAVQEASDHGIVTLVGGCVSLTGKLPLLPFVEALGGMSDDVAEGSLRLIPPALRNSLAAVMPGRFVETGPPRAPEKSGFSSSGRM